MSVYRKVRGGPFARWLASDGLSRRQRLRQAGIDARVAISGTGGGSHALARFSADVATMVHRTGCPPDRAAIDRRAAPAGRHRNCAWASIVCVTAGDAASAVVAALRLHRLSATSPGDWLDFGADRSDQARGDDQGSADFRRAGQRRKDGRALR